MAWFDPIQNFINELEEKRFYQYAAIILSCLILLMFGLLFYYYRSTSALHQELDELNETREKVQKILERGQQVRFQQKEVNELLARDPNFKIKGYFQTLLADLNLTNNLTTIQVTSPTGEGAYNETTLTAQLTDMTMKDLTTLLDKIEQKKRVYTKELEINTSQKIPNRIDVILVIGTLEPKE